ncbi:MAG: ACT domain-containing protein [Candidatus Mariimomonas ferrooxydans]
MVEVVWRGRGVSIHSLGCQKLDLLAIDRDRFIDVEWISNGNTDSNYTVRISVFTIDKTGILADLSAIISANNININRIDASTTRDKQAHFNLILEVKNKPQLNEIIKKLYQVNGVIEIKRAEGT